MTSFPLLLLSTLALLIITSLIFFISSWSIMSSSSFSSFFSFSFSLPQPPSTSSLPSPSLRASQIGGFFIPPNDVDDEFISKTKANRERVSSLLQEMVDRRDCALPPPAPDLLDIVITWVNFTEPSHDRFPYIFSSDDESLNCTHSLLAYLPPDKSGHQCSAASSSFCCSADRKCVEPSDENRHCRCAHCWDARISRAEGTHVELKYVLRALAKHGLAPNQGIVRHIYIVYNRSYGNGPPTWLDLDNGPVKAIDHAEIFAHPERDLPSNNRNAILNHVHRIPNLLDWFLYFEDDMFLREDFQLSWFFREDLIIAHLNKWYSSGFGVEGRPFGVNGWQGAAAHTVELLDDLFGQPPLAGRHIVSHHEPMLVARCVMRAVEWLFPEPFNRTAQHQTAQADDIQPHTMYAHLAMELGLAVNLPDERLSFNLHAQQGGLPEGFEEARDDEQNALLIEQALNGNVSSSSAVANDVNLPFYNIQGEGISEDYYSLGKPVHSDIRAVFLDWLENEFPERQVWEGKRDRNSPLLTHLTPPMRFFNRFATRHNIVYSSHYQY